MSIPKEPRALMINIMYLVLTAMLALNVSAEIFNAFKVVDKGLKKSNHAMETANDALPESIRDGAKKKKALAKYADAIDPARSKAKTLNEEIDQMINKLIDMGGNMNGKYDDGDYVTKDGKVTTNLRGKKNKDITTRYLVKEGAGEELKQKLLAFRQDIINMADEEDREAFSKEIPEIIDDKSWQDKYGGKKGHSWATFNFKQMPLQAVLPILRKLQNDVISTESSFLNYLAGKVGGTELVFDRFAVVSSPEKTYVINGEKFKTEVFLSASASSESNTGIALKVNGRSLATNSDGVATFEETARGVGKKSYVVEGVITDPVTGDVKPFKKTYEYEVGERSAAISASKMNVFYIGVDNPVEVSVAGVPSSQVKVSMGGSGGGSINKNSDGTYNVRVTKPTSRGQSAKVNLTAPGFTASKEFRVKRIPDPIPMLSDKRGGSMPSGTFKAQGGVAAILQGFDFDAKCKIKGYRVVRAPKRADPEFAINPGAAYGGDARRVVSKATPGDRYFFENIKCECPGDAVARDLGGMNFVIK